ncbi:hypothetical protein [uncultured Kordia sp.]|uniref:hypothetical protein n=1 Tax=uncultured Kordia sp. TaxID=507699 RepID=UPI00260FC06D|nr:hypothetical protein [uncultured Kordia sp.]
MSEFDFSAKEWAKNYFLRLEKVIKNLESSPLVDKIIFTQYKGLSDSEIDAVEADIALELSEEGDVSFKFTEYIREFYKISNGLNIIWHSNIISSEIEVKTITNASVDQFIAADYDFDGFEGNLCLLPLSHILSPYKVNVMGDLDYTGYAEDLKENNGGMLVFLDYYNTYYDTCMVLSEENSNPYLAFGEDHSAAYTDKVHCDFVTYLEHQLYTLFAVEAKSCGLTLPTSDRTYAMRDMLAEIKEPSATQYEAYVNFLNADPLALETVLKYHYEDDELGYIDIEKIKSKSAEEQKIIEGFIGIEIDELE